MENAGMQREGILRAYATNAEEIPVDCIVCSWVRGRSDAATEG
jgi:hypothetical protein